jgi:hypothetical protein
MEKKMFQKWLVGGLEHEFYEFPYIGIETTNQMIIDVRKIVEIFDIPYRSLFDIFVDVWFAMLYISVQLKGNK